MKINAYETNTTFKSLFKKKENSSKSPKVKTHAGAPAFEVKNLLAQSLFKKEAKDTFTPKIITTYMPGGYGTPEIRGRLIKNIPLKDADGKDIRGFIIQEIEDSDTYYACTKKNALCEMSIKHAHPFGVGYIFINSLYGQANDGKIKGAGTELIKFAVQKSKEAGCDGRVELCMAGSYPFYFKNNFRAGRGRSEHLRMDAAMDYITRKNIPAEKLWRQNFDDIYVILDEKGAEALLSGVRYFDSSKSETMCSKAIECESKSGNKYKIDADIDFSDLSDSEKDKKSYVIQIISKSKDGLYKQVAALEMQLLKDEDGEKYLEAENIYIEKSGTPLEQALYQEAFRAAEIKAKELGAKYIKTEILNINRE